MAEIERAVVDAFVTEAAAQDITLDKHNIYFSAPAQ